MGHPQHHIGAATGGLMQPSEPSITASVRTICNPRLSDLQAEPVGQIRPSSCTTVEPAPSVRRECHRTLTGGRVERMLDRVLHQFTVTTMINAVARSASTLPTP
jgi:hypothetical protein